MSKLIPLNSNGDKRWCTCKEYKPTTEFHNDRKGVAGVGSQCKLCANTNSKKHHHRKMKDNPEYRQAKRDSYMLARWGFTREEYDKRLEIQGACAICGDKSPANWHLDHCHATGIIREFLCGNCNRGLGQFKDDEVLMQTAIDYLRKHRKGTDLPIEGRSP